MENHRYETVLLNPETVELRWYESLHDRTYRSWKMHRSVAAAVADWWRHSGVHSLELKKTRSGMVEITRVSPSYAEIRALDPKGRPHMTGWSLPIPAVMALAAELSIPFNTDTPREKGE